MVNYSSEISIRHKAQEKFHISLNTSLSYGDYSKLYIVTIAVQSNGCSYFRSIHVLKENLAFIWPNEVQPKRHKHYSL
jgi:hypothetical protein